MTLDPSSEEEAAAAVLEARGARKTLRLEGGGTRSGFGRSVEADSVITTRRLRGITLHEPAELVIAARGGTPVRDLEAALAAHGQRLPVEPMDHRPLYGTAGEPTVGGLVATNASGPRRFAAGAIRDHLIGIRLINGRGEAVKSGGRVMKNVTGLDLVKLVCGSHGTLGLVTEATFKVLPRPEASATLVWSGLDDGPATEAMTLAIGSPFEVSGAAHVPAGPGRHEARTMLRLEGFELAVRQRLPRLASLHGSLGTAEALSGDEETSLWADVRDARFLAADPRTVLWRVSVPPTRGPEFALHVRDLTLDRFYDWGGGLVWLAVAPTGDAGAARFRAALAPFGGHATLLRAPAEIRGRIDVFEPLAPALRAITAGIKASFDPDAILNPGRMYRGV